MGQHNAPASLEACTSTSSSACLVGLTGILFSVADLLVQAAEYRSQWLSLVADRPQRALPVSFPQSTSASRISETFVIAGTLLFGRSGGTVLVLLDALSFRFSLFG